MKGERPLPPDIVRASHVEFLVSDLQRSRRFYVDVLGFTVSHEDSRSIHLRGIEDRMHHCLTLTKSSRTGIGHIAFRVRGGEDMDRAAALLDEEGLRFIDVEAGGEEGIGRAIRFQDRFGFPVELFNESEGREWMLQRFHSQHGAKVMRLDHFNLFVRDVDAALSWYEGSLSFAVSEYVEGRRGGGRVSAAWLRRKPSSHDVALMEGKGPRFHHAGFIVNDRDSILDAADILSSSGYSASIERGPGRHGITNAFFLYLRDPDGIRIELYTGDYLAADPYLPPVVWKPTDPQRQTFWGTPAPESWWRDASPVYHVFGGKAVRTGPAAHDA